MNSFRRVSTFSCTVLNAASRTRPSAPPHPKRRGGRGALVGCYGTVLSIKGVFGWYGLEQDRTAGAHRAASCQPNSTPETEHIFVERVPNSEHSSKCVRVTMVTLT